MFVLKAIAFLFIIFFAFSAYAILSTPDELIIDGLMLSGFGAFWFYLIDKKYSHSEKSKGQKILGVLFMGSAYGFFWLGHILGLVMINTLLKKTGAHLLNMGQWNGLEFMYFMFFGPGILMFLIAAFLGHHFLKNKKSPKSEL